MTLNTDIKESECRAFSLRKNRIKEEQGRRRYPNIDQYQIRDSANLSRISTFGPQPDEVRVAEGLTDKEKGWDDRILCEDTDELLAALPMPNFAVIILPGYKDLILRRQIIYYSHP